MEFVNKLTQFKLSLTDEEFLQQCRIYGFSEPFSLKKRVHFIQRVMNASFTNEKVSEFSDASLCDDVSDDDESDDKKPLNKDVMSMKHDADLINCTVTALVGSKENVAKFLRLYAAKNKISEFVRVFAKAGECWVAVCWLLGRFWIALY